MGKLSNVLLHIAKTHSTTEGIKFCIICIYFVFSKWLISVIVLDVIVLLWQLQVTDLYPLYYI